MGAFKTEPKMKTTEPSVELKLKKGGHAKTKKADGGMPMVSRPAPALMRQRPMIRPAAAPIMRKVGGMAEGGESKSMHAGEMKRMSKVEREIRNESEEIGRVKGKLQRHEMQAASKAHKGLKEGGSAIRAVPGGLLPGVTKAHGKGTTGGVREPGYKKGGSIAAYANTKMHDDEHGNAVKKSTSGGVEGPGYKKGGHAGKKHHYAKGGGVSAYVNTKMHDASSGTAVKKKTTGDIERSKYKDGGHVAMKCHSEGGFTAMKKMSKC